MKKSERKKVKLLMLKYVSQNVNIAKNDLAADWPTKGGTWSRNVIRNDIKLLHGALFIRRAVEKQMPMPVRIEAKVSAFCKYWYDNGIKHLNLMYNAYCQNCGNKVDLGYKMLDDLERDKNVKYCPRCGQKLWWPSC